MKAMGTSATGKAMKKASTGPNQPPIQYWDNGDFRDMSGSDSDTILKAFIAKKDSCTISKHNYTKLKLLLEGGSLQHHAQSGRTRYIRVRLPYAFDEKAGIFTILPKPEITDYEYTEEKKQKGQNQIYKRLDEDQNEILTFQLACTPVLTKTYVSLGIQKTYALTVDTPANSKTKKRKKHSTDL